MPVVTQFNIVMENKPGELARLGDALAREKVNIEALAVSDTTDTGEVRLIARSPANARQALKKIGVPVFEVSVLQIEVFNKPGALAEIARKLAKGKVNILYLYTGPAGPRGTASVILRVSNPRKAAALLE